MPDLREVFANGAERICEVMTMNEQIDKIDLLHDMIATHIKGKRYTIITLSDEDCEIIMDALMMREALYKLEDDHK